jgi:hypothetical protein
MKRTSAVVNYEITMTPKLEHIPIQFLDNFARECVNANLVQDWVGVNHFIPTYRVTNNELSLSHDGVDLISFDGDGFDINFDLLKLDEAYQNEGKRAFDTHKDFPYGFECEIFSAPAIDMGNPEIRALFSIRAGYSYPYRDFASINDEVVSMLGAEGNIDDIFKIVTPFLRVDLQHEQGI